MKKISIFLVLLLSIFMLTGCTGSSMTDDTKEINFTVPDGLPAISVAKIIKERPEIKKGYNVKYNIEKTSDNVVTSVMKGEPDIAIVPSNLAATSFNKNGDYVIAGTVGWGSFFLVSTEADQTVESLKGKEIYNIGKGLTPDIITKLVLKNKGIDVDKDINFSYVGGVTELSPIILSDKAKYAVLPEPALSNVSSKKENLNVILNLNEEWKKDNNIEYGFPQSTIIIKKDLVSKDKKFVDNILKEIKNSTTWAYEDREGLGTYCEEIGVSAKKPIIISAMDKSNIKYIDIKDSIKEYQTYFNKLYEFDSNTVGGKVPDEGIYMEK